MVKVRTRTEPVYVRALEPVDGWLVPVSRENGNTPDERERQFRLDRWLYSFMANDEEVLLTVERTTYEDGEVIGYEWAMWDGDRPPDYTPENEDDHGSVPYRCSWDDDVHPEYIAFETKEDAVADAMTHMERMPWDEGEEDSASAYIREIIVEIDQEMAELLDDRRRLVWILEDRGESVEDGVMAYDGEQ